MPILVLLLILTGSVLATTILVAQGAGLAAIALGYCVGGWLGLIFGLPLVWAWRSVAHLWPGDRC